MNILNVNMSVNPVTGGGTVERVLKLHQALIRSGMQSHVLTLANGPEFPSSLSDAEVTELPCWNKRWHLPVPCFKTVKELVTWADVIHLMNHWTIINAWVYLIAWRSGKPYVVCPAGALTIFGRSRVKKNIYQFFIGHRLLQNASAGIMISPGEFNYFKKAGLSPEAIHHIPNGVNEEDFSCNDPKVFRQAAGIGEVAFLLFLGRLNAIKGPDLLLRAFAKVQDKFPHHLVFIGPDGGMAGELEQLCIDLDLTNRVHFAGFAGGDLKSSAYHGAELLIVPSRFEAMSIVALEAAITGTPVLLTDQCGFAQLAAAGAAIEVSATVDGLMEGLLTLLKDPLYLKKMGERGRTYSRENYTWDIAAKKHIDLFSRLL